MPYTPSPQQQAFFDWIATGKGNATLEAVAGAGKTTTLLEASRLMTGSTVFCCYANAAAKDIKAKAEEKSCTRPDLRIGTVHSLCFGAWRNMAPGVQVEDNKVYQIIDALGEAEPAIAAKLEVYRATIKKMVSFGRNFLMGVPDLANPQTTRQRDVNNFKVWAKLAEHFSVFDDLPEEANTDELISFVVRVFEISASQCRTVIDFDDMIYAPLRFRARFFKNDWFLGDEWQDANPARREAAKRMLKPGGRAVFVGDEKQSIFGFTGAGNDSMARTAAEFGCEKLPLTVTFRCPKAVVEYVHQWVSHIEVHPNAPQGLVAPVPFDGNVKGTEGKVVPWFMQGQKPAPTDAILCRYNKPLVMTAFAMLRNGIPCQVEGRDIGKNLITLATRWKVKTLEALEKKLAVYLEREVTKAREQENERKEQDVRDRVETLLVFVARCREQGKHDLDCVVTEITRMFADGVKGVTALASGHKSKGREWGRVYWLNHTLRTKRPLKDWEAQQESNINYVLGTRVEGVHGAGELWLVPEQVQKTCGLA